MSSNAEIFFKEKLAEYDIPCENVSENTWSALRIVRKDLIDIIDEIFSPYFSFIAERGLIAYSYSNEPVLYFSEKFTAKAINSYGGFKFIKNGCIEVAYSTRRRIANDKVKFMTAAEESGFCKPYNKEKDWYFADMSAANKSELMNLNDIWFSSFSDMDKNVISVSGTVTIPHSGSMEIAIKKLDNEVLNFKLNSPNDILLSIEDVSYQAFLRHTDKNGYWVSPYCFINGNKIKLIDVLSDAGFKEKDTVNISFAGHNGRIILPRNNSAKVVTIQETNVMNKIEHNQVLFGPPGTGKTYNTIDEALNILDQDYLQANRSERKLLKERFDQLLEVGRIRFVTFHQSFSYEDFVEGLKAESREDGSLCYKVVDGLFKQICQRAEEDPDNPYVLIIDEINRGNISRIFGELITLLESSKRLWAEEELKVQLPYSKDEKLFGVPGNLYVIGTMNTADRSLAGLDLALRRRFFFQEMPPRPELLDQLVVDGVPIGALLRIINRRITALLGRDYCLGHAIFMPLCDDRSLQRLATIFQKQVLPLLQEYFFEDWQKIALVLNDHRKSGKTRFVVEDESLELIALFGPEEGGKMNNLPTGWRVCDEADPVWMSTSAYLGTIGHTGEGSVA